MFIEKPIPAHKIFTARQLPCCFLSFVKQNQMSETLKSGLTGCAPFLQSQSTIVFMENTDVRINVFHSQTLYDLIVEF